MPEYLAQHAIKLSLTDRSTVWVNVDSSLGDWPSAESLGLDESQKIAFRFSLFNKVALIQGPPGTGKSHLAVKMIETLLLNRRLWEQRQTETEVILIFSHNFGLHLTIFSVLDVFCCGDCTVKSHNRSYPRISFREH